MERFVARAVKAVYWQEKEVCVSVQGGDCDEGVLPVAVEGVSEEISEKADAGEGQEAGLIFRYNMLRKSGSTVKRPKNNCCLEGGLSTGHV